MRLFYCIIFLAAFLVIGCKPNYDAPCRAQAVQLTTNLTTAQLLKFPYGQQDTILFVSNQLDTLFLTSTLVRFASYKPTIVRGNPECPQDVDAFQILQAIVKDSITGFNFTYSFLKATDTCIVDINNNVFGIAINLIDSATSSFFDSIVLPTRTFYRATSLINTRGDSVLITAQNGLVYFTSGSKSYSQLKFNSK